MKINSHKLHTRVFWLGGCLSMLALYFLALIVLGATHYAQIQMQQQSLEQTAQKELNLLVQLHEDEAASNPNDIFMSYSKITPFISEKRVRFYMNDALLFDSFPAKSLTDGATDPRNTLHSECTAAMSDNQYRLIISKDISQVTKRTLLFAYLLIPICVIFSALLGILFAYMITFWRSDLAQVTSFLNCVSGNSYPSPLSPCGTDELDSLVDAANHLSSEVQHSLTNYKDAIDAFIHEVKTPLTSIIGYSELLRGFSDLTPTDQSYLDYIIVESRRLNALTRKIIYFLSVDQQKIDCHRHCPGDIIGAAILSTRSSARLKSIQVVYQPNEIAYLYVDEQLLTTCIVNILENAIKASSHESTVLITLQTEKNAVSEITVQDFGTGIPKSDLNKIFQPFYMLHKSEGPLENGLGLGLAICQSIAEAHGCHISVTSEVQVGTSVKIAFPFAQYQHLHSLEHPEIGNAEPLYILPVHP